jgi:cell division transport system permease protein
MNRTGARIGAALRSAVHGLRSSPLASLVAAGTIGLCLLLVGAFALLVSNMERMLDRFGEEIRISAFLEDGLSEQEQDALAARVVTAPGVEAVDLVSADEALARFQESAFGREALFDGMETNPLPASLEIMLAPQHRDAEGLRVLAGSIDGLPGIAELGYGHEWIEGYERAVGLVRGMALVIGGVLALATILIVANTIRLSVYTRRDEIEILRLVGGSRAFIASPFLVEGLAQGLAGGLLALTLLFVLFRGLLPTFEAGLELVLGYATPTFLGFEGSLLVVLAGALLGVVGCAAALAQEEGLR